MKKMKEKKQSIKIIVISIVVACLMISGLMINFNSMKSKLNNGAIIIDENEDMRAANGNLKSLNYSSIFRNASSAYRLFDPVRFDVNTSGFTGVNSTFMQIEFSNKITKTYEMIWVKGTNNFTYTYIPEYDAPLGFANISFILYDVEKNQLNSQNMRTNLTILSNYVAHVDKKSYKRNEMVYGEIMVSNFRTYNFKWNVTVVDSDNETIQKNMFNLGNDIQTFSFKVDDRFQILDTFYYVKINMSDAGSGKNTPAYIPFKVLNTAPEIIASSINFSSTTIKRLENCKVEVLISDVDPLTTPDNISVVLKITTPTGQELSPITFNNLGNWRYNTTFKIKGNKPIGIYKIKFEATDQYGGVGNYTTSLQVENNPPEIHDYWINDVALTEPFSINYREDLVFTFNISDVENSITYVTVSLLDEDGNWFNITKEYKNNLAITIRTVDLKTGIWKVYISIVDADGAVTRITSDIGLGPKEIRIIPDLLTPILPWITMFIGLFFGFIIGFGIIFKKYRSILSKIQGKPTKKEKYKRKPISKEKKVKKVKAAPIEEPEKIPEELEKEEPEKEPKKKPQRRIKRKLG